MTRVYAGASKRRITPDHARGPVFLAGFQANRRATAVHDDLYARALVIRVGDTEPEAGQPELFGLVVCDLIGLLHADVLAIRRAVHDRV